MDDADERLLELAEATGLPVISADRFRGHRTEYGWLQGNTHQFQEPHVDADGGMTVRPVDMGVVAEWQISRHAEQDQLKKQGLLAGRRRTPRYDILDRMWSCPDNGCTLYDARHGTHVLLPRLRRGVPTCGLHGLELTDDGPRPLIVQLKLLLDGECVERFTCRGETEVPVGRAPSTGISLEPWLSSKEITLVSRHHFSLTLKNGGLWVRDHSTNGTKIAAENGSETRLVPGREYPVKPSDRIMCSPRIALARSGRRFPTELAMDYSRVTSAGGATPTSRIDSH
ncbi:hypothetical protein GCM10023074_60150 [Microbispora amethystogenes]|uniref:FHA domain-containing protein n=1 Tax=Microbispora amethystogenes TaxID=1427754 RepID=A0ABQ4FN55_9ACTN|nr:hypothetical protein Mam01_64160 [Microbispora amethystogenes]